MRIITIVCVIHKVLPKKNNFFFFLNVIDHERIALGNEEGLFVVHVTKDGKKLGTGNNFPNTKSSFPYSVSSGLIFHYLLHYQLDSSMREQQVFCMLSGLGILSNNKVLKCSWSFFPHFSTKCLYTDFRPGSSGPYPVECWKSPRIQVPWSLCSACCKLLSKWNISFVYSAGTSLIWISCSAAQQE